MAPWGYSKENGPATWHKDCPIANTGVRQSPIDLITTGQTCAKYDSNLKPVIVSYPAFSEATFLNNGHSVQFQPSAGNLSELSGGPLTKKYKFEQFHFHWGNNDSEGSEHRVNGKMYPAELHLVHWNSESPNFSSFQEAVGSNDPHALCVLGFFLKVGAENASLKPITDLLSKVKNAGSSVSFPGKFDLKAVLPETLTDYYTYDGSLTTPPLAECVKWIVFKEPIEVSTAQMEAFRAVDDGHGKPITGNYRPPCPLHTRTVAASFK
ncbi:Phospholipase A2 crotoxin acid subunit CA [Desmophyllum pertusum]|uniref:Carbonic anhydrase n=1 Tax=Desmophyllum pertusum TaxID=174260 RepID=A0A9W9ZU83_9CNID|nr:Phospholipase A2 crotoxin acid subunit CA [Desmophyllum pertusum]